MVCWWCAGGGSAVIRFDGYEELGREVTCILVLSFRGWGGVKVRGFLVVCGLVVWGSLA